MSRSIPLLCLTVCCVFGTAGIAQQRVPVVFTIDSALSEVEIGLSVVGSSDNDASAISGTLEATLDIDTSGSAPLITGIEFTGGAFTNNEPFNLSLTVLGFLTANIEGRDFVGTTTTPMPPSIVTPDPADPLRFEYDAADHFLTIDQGVLNVSGAFNEMLDLSQSPVSGMPPAGSLATIELTPGGMLGGFTEFAAMLVQPLAFRDTFNVDTGVFVIPVTVDVAGQAIAMTTFSLELGGGGTAGPGDYNGNGLVEQGDLDLVLLHWGGDASSVPAFWSHDLPTGIIDQDELDGVLLNWGNAAAAATPVPEPVTALLAILAAGCGYVSTRRRPGSKKSTP